MATSQNVNKSNLNEVSMIPKHIKMLLINDAEALVSYKNSLFNFIALSPKKV